MKYSNSIFDISTNPTINPSYASFPVKKDAPLRLSAGKPASSKGQDQGAKLQAGTEHNLNEDGFARKECECLEKD